MEVSINIAFNRHMSLKNQFFWEQLSSVFTVHFADTELI